MGEQGIRLMSKPGSSEQGCGQGKERSKGESKEESKAKPEREKGNKGSSKGTTDQDSGALRERARRVRAEGRVWAESGVGWGGMRSGRRRVLGDLSWITIPLVHQVYL